MYKKIIGLSLVLVFIIVGLFFYYAYHNLEPSTRSVDIEIVSTVEPYEDEYYNYLVKMDIKRKDNDNSSHMVYPIIEGLQGINFIHDQGYYTPSSIGIWPKAEEVLHGTRTHQEEEQLMGFAIPKEKGDYKSKFLLKTTDDFTGIEEGTLYYIHIEEKLGKDLNWVEEYKIKVLK